LQGSIDVSPLHLFEGFGIELEYMIVDADTLDVRPITDELFRSVAGEYVSDVERGPITWSNELASHVVELKTTTPAPSLNGLAELFQQEVREINRLLEPFGARLLGTAMHPWMDPHREMRLWPHENSAIYDAFNRVFDCRGHGWANLQSMHINLPFCGDEEFARLHAAVRLILPLLPALAASSPIMDGRVTGILDNRLEVYRQNSRRIPEVAGHIIPERAFSEAEYDRLIFQSMYRAIAPFDPDGVLQEEFLNARGAIARFSRGSIEIRLLDVQECPQADLAIAAAVIDVLRRMVAEEWSDLASQQAVDVESLTPILDRTISHAEQAVIDDARLLRQFGIPAGAPCALSEVWSQVRPGAASRPVAPLARRILARLSATHDDGRLRTIYGDLADCLAAGSLFT
jgi:hypothetical protein